MPDESECTARRLSVSILSQACGSGRTDAGLDGQTERPKTGHCDSEVGRVASGSKPRGNIITVSTGPLR